MLLSQTCSSFVSKRYIVLTRLTYTIFDGTINQAPQLCSVFAARVGLAVFNILKAFSAAASKLETIRQVDAKNQNAPSETKPLIVHKLSHHLSFGSLVKEASSLVNEVKWNTFCSSFAVLDSGLGSEMGDPSQRSLGGKAVKPTQNSISTLGDELVVGVVSNDEIIANKGPPVTPLHERMIMVKAVKWVDEVIPDAPYAITEEFMKRLFDEYLIDYINHGADPCVLPDGTDAYALAKKAGRYKKIKRIEGVSSTDIVGRMLLCVRERSNSQNHSSLQRQFSHGHNSPRFEDGASSAGGPGAHIIYIDGAFDLFHAGHVEILRRARELGDIIKRALICYFFYKNITFGLTLFYFEAFTGFSGQAIYNDSDLLLFNVVLTSLPVISLGVFEQDVSSEFCLQFPALYQQGPKNLFFDWYRILRWMGSNGVYASIVIFALNLGIFHVQSLCSNGQTADMNAMGTAIFTCIVWAVNAQIALTMSHFTWIQHALIWESIFTWYIFLALFGMLPPKISGNILHMLLEALAPAPIFWLTTLLVIATTTLPYLAHISFQRSLNPLDHHIIQEIKHFKIDVQDERMWTRERSKARQKTKIGFIARVDAKIRQLRGRLQKKHLILSVVRGMSGMSASASSETTTTTTHHS
uniref:ethanolamine-phosphate cytidylyltransferase n=1 Tax=Brassica campestris TaxID=3711 RepID=M4E767_BRACM